MKVYQVISAVAKDLCAVGIAKTGQNREQNYSFRGIDSFLNTLSPILTKHGLVIVPRYGTPTLIEAGKTAKGNSIMYATVLGEFDLIAAEDGTKHTAVCIGEGKDSGDKAISKAMSTAFKYMAAQSFCIPFVGMSDPEDEHVESEGGTMDPHKKSDLMLMIKEAANLDELRNAWTTATQAAQAVGDSASFQEFTALKDERKKGLK